MRVVFVSDSFHHHQKPFSDQMYLLTGGNYIFIATGEISQERKSMGWGINENTPYLMILDSHNKNQLRKVKQIIADADFVITGSAPLSLFSLRNKKRKLIFRYSERLYKSKLRYLKAFLYTFDALRMKNDYMLCSSAYTALDYSLTRCYIGKCYKWGYFTECRSYDSHNELFAKKSLDNEPIKILWVSRFISWKHPEVPILLAEKLKKDNITFQLQMLGVGPLKSKIQDKINSLELSQYVSLLDSIPPSEVRNLMEESDIFLFTSDRGEGWGAVLNESMNSGCAVLANTDIGSVPYLIKDGMSGCTYKDGDIDDAYRKLVRLINDQVFRRRLAEEAYKTISNVWNPNVAAKNLLLLYENLQSNNDNQIEHGPCSPAFPLDLPNKKIINYPRFNIFESLRFFIADLIR